MAGPVYKTRIKKGDTIMVRSGKYKGQTGKVLAVHRQANKVTVEGINIAKRHRKPTQQQPQGGLIEITKPIWISKVGIVDSSAKKPSRIGYKTDQKGNKLRYFKSSSKEIK